jgi:hypothetical protein
MFLNYFAVKPRLANHDPTGELQIGFNRANSKDGRQ